MKEKKPLFWATMAGLLYFGVLGGMSVIKRIFTGKWIEIP